MVPTMHKKVKGNGKSKKAFITIQVVTILVFAGALGGMLVFTDVYDETYSRIVSIICLSCIKLDRIYSIDYRFDTANNEPYPQFIIEDLKEGPIFLAFRTDVCDYCDYMEPLIIEIFDVTFEMEEVIKETVDFNGTDIIFYHINNDHATGELKTLQPYFDIDGDNGVPMFTILSLEYNHGIVSPYYLTVYGILNPDYTDKERMEEITNNMLKAIEVYKENRQGFIPEDFIK
jgi:thiol-disulfide isomerase/thioredoxin